MEDSRPIRHATNDRSAGTMFSVADLSQPPLIDAYAARELEESRDAAVEIWGFRVQICGLIQIIFSIVLFASSFWYANFVGFSVGFIGIYGVRRKMSEFLIVVCFAFSDLGSLWSY